MARIVFTLEDGTEIETELDSDVITVGRHPDSIVVLPSASVSSHHATIKRRGESYYVQDLGTTNGTKLNGVEVEEAKLEDGDKVTFGDIPGLVHLTDAPARSAMPLPDAAKAPAASPAPRTSSGRRSGSGRPRASTLPQYKESTGCAGFLIFLLLLLFAFVIGLHVRHGVETGGFMIGDVLRKIKERTAAGIEQDAVPDKSGQDKTQPGQPPASTTPQPVTPAAPAPPMENK